MARLARAAHAVVWVNPLKGNPEYQPLAGGMRAALPYVDRLVAGHNLASLEALARRPRRPRAPARGLSIARRSGDHRCRGLRTPSARDLEDLRTTKSERAPRPRHDRVRGSSGGRAGRYQRMRRRGRSSGSRSGRRGAADRRGESLVATSAPRRAGHRPRASVETDARASRSSCGASATARLLDDRAGRRRRLELAVPCDRGCYARGSRCASATAAGARARPAAACRRRRGRDRDALSAVDASGGIAQELVHVRLFRLPVLVARLRPLALVLAARLRLRRARRRAGSRSRPASVGATILAVRARGRLRARTTPTRSMRGILVLALIGAAATILAFLALQRYLVRGCPTARRAAPVPVCGFAVGAASTCEGCGRRSSRRAQLRRASRVALGTARPAARPDARSSGTRVIPRVPTAPPARLQPIGENRRVCVTPV